MNSPIRRNASWQLPEGVSSGTWDYARTDSIASDYDRYFAEHGMFRLDQEVTQRYLEPGKWVIDLGCGTGRALVPLVEKGLHGVAFDLSQSMLDTVQQKLLDENKADNRTSGIHCVRGNLVDLRCFAEASFDYAICLFSTLGMIRSSKSRRQMIEHTARILKPDGLLILQVHNYWVHMFDPDGPLWMIRNFCRAKYRRDVEVGDRFFPYRGIPDMYLHSFGSGELKSLLTNNSFEIVEWLPLNANQNGTLKWPGLLSYLRASGWIVVARKKGSAHNA